MKKRIMIFLIDLILGIALVFIALVLIGLIVPFDFHRHRRGEASRYACMENLMKIDMAKQQYALDHNLTMNFVPTWDDIVDAEKSGYLKLVPTCPSEGAYSILAVEDVPECSKKDEGHVW